MRKSIISLCTILIAASLSGCGHFSDETPESTTTSSNTTVSVNTTMTSEKAQIEVSSAESNSTSRISTSTSITTTTATTEITTEMRGDGGDIETELYRLFGYWESTDREQSRYIVNNEFTLSRNGEILYGNLIHTDRDLPDSFSLMDNESGLTYGRYVHRDQNRFGRMIYTEDGIDTEYIFAGDLQPSFVSAETGTFTYYGVQYNDPVTIELTARADVTDIKLLKLSDSKIKENGDITFDTECVMELPSLEKGRSFTPIVEIPEIIPKYGFSYVDEHGNVHYFDIGMSGRDGSIIVTPFQMD